MGDIESVQRYAYLRNKGKFVDFVYGVERRFPKFITRYFYKPQLVISGSFLEKEISSQYVQYHNDNSFFRKKPLSMVTFWFTFLYLVLFMGNDRVWRSLERLKLRIFLSRLLLFEKRSEKYFLSIIQSIGARVYIHFEALFSWKSNKVRSVEYLHRYLKEISRHIFRTI